MTNKSKTLDAGKEVADAIDELAFQELSAYKPAGEVWKPGKKEAATEIIPTIEVNPQGGLVKAWSASILDKFESCPYSVKLGKVDKIPQESNEAMDRGSMIHGLAEDYMIGKIDELPQELERYKSGFERLREGYAAGKVYVEDDWGFDVNWDITGWMDKDIWARMKLDACEYEDENSVRVIDFKTGRKFGNEIKHNRQAMIYAVGTFMRDPKVQFVTTEFWYLDKNEGPLVNQYNKKKIAILLPRINERAIKMTSCTDFRPKPSAQACKWCSYKDEHCEWSFQE